MRPRVDEEKTLKRIHETLRHVDTQTLRHLNPLTSQHLNHAILLLAAGSSSRMGQSKQLLSVDGDSLLTRSVKTASAVATTVAVVLGYRFEEHRQTLKGLPVLITENAEWSKGMGSSLKAGLAEILRTVPIVESVTIMVCDQPNVSPAHLARLRDESEKSSKPIIASSYAGTFGVPVLFKKEVFADLLAIRDDAGAAKLIRQYPQLVEPVDFPEGTMDLDTPADYKLFLSGRKQ